MDKNTKKALVAGSALLGIGVGAAWLYARRQPTPLLPSPPAPAIAVAPVTPPPPALPDKPVEPKPPVAAQPSFQVPTPSLPAAPQPPVMPAVQNSGTTLGTVLTDVAEAAPLIALALPLLLGHSRGRGGRGGYSAGAGLGQPTGAPKDGPIAQPAPPDVDTWADDYWKAYLLGLQDPAAANRLMQANPANNYIQRGGFDGINKIHYRDPQGLVPTAAQLPPGLVLPPLPNYREGQMISLKESTQVWQILHGQKHQMSDGAVQRNGGWAAVLDVTPGDFYWYPVGDPFA